MLHHGHHFAGYSGRDIVYTVTEHRAEHCPPTARPSQSLHRARFAEHCLPLVPFKEWFERLESLSTSKSQAGSKMAQDGRGAAYPSGSTDLLYSVT
ncbi:hypothetical protein FIBSPDRAFT_27759 [Athelia psychrophila]|uniref:Uncharacterized protein n=1 Tax=Athelia psychrophila TaxID=1759441 RepID=A0A166G641_9AGAM|nr:hypothetical protein FIBSPDRAFT_27759 [Fibularhizoctonia sp. CBS 109695]